MLKPIICVSAFILFFQCCISETGEDIFRKMHARYAGKWHHALTFVQTTEYYRNDSLIKSETWYEAMRFPYDMRVDFGPLSEGNAVIYRKDSVYRMQNGKLKIVDTRFNPYIVLLGGMYFIPFDSAIMVLKSQGYDFSKAHRRTWNNREVLVVGALQGDSISKQFWVDSENLYIVRSIEKQNNTVIDAHWSNHIKLKNSWSERLVTIYYNGKLRLKEKYADLKNHAELDDRLFDAAHFGSLHWTEK